MAADGGLAYLEQLHVLPDYIVGDFDSLGYQPQGDCVAVYPVEKDDTDLLLAVKYGLRAGIQTFRIYGGLGGRVSHTMANIQVLQFLSSQGCHGVLVDGSSILTAIHQERLIVEDSARGMLSLFALGGAAAHVTIRNLKYCVEDVRLTPDYPLGVSNEFIGKEAEISVQDGTLLVVWEHEASDFEKLHFDKLPCEAECNL